MKDPSAFWDWFEANEGRFRGLKSEEDLDLIDEVESKLRETYCELFFEVRGEAEGSCELVITAEGNPELFDAVRELVEFAPEVEGWKVVAFKPPGGFEMTVDAEGVGLDPSDLWFIALESEGQPDLLGIRIAIPGYNPAARDDYLFECYRLLDAGLGELAAFEVVDHLEVESLPKDPSAEGYLPLTHLPDFLTWREHQAGNQSEE